MRTAFIGEHDLLPEGIREKLAAAVQNEIDLGCTHFMMGAQGEFADAALAACLGWQRTNPNLKITVALTRIPGLHDEAFWYPKGVDTMMYEVGHMIDACDTLICYVRPGRWRSGAETIRQYAARRGVKIVNLYVSDDDGG